MSTSPKTKTQSKNDQEKTALIGVILIITVVLGIGIASFYAGKNQGDHGKAGATIINISKPLTPTVLGDQTNNWNGKITGIDGVRITFTVTYSDQNNVVKTKNIIAIIQPSTQLLKWDLTKPATDHPGSSKETITLNQLAVGERVLVQASADPNGQQEVAASAINVLITPGSQ